MLPEKFKLTLLTISSIASKRKTPLIYIALGFIDRRDKWPFQLAIYIRSTHLIDIDHCLQLCGASLEVIQSLLQTQGRQPEAGEVQHGAGEGGGGPTTQQLPGGGEAPLQGDQQERGEDRTRE